MPARTRNVVLALSALALIVLATTLKFGLTTVTPTAPLPNPATIPVQQRAAAAEQPATPEAAPAAPAEAPAPTSTIVPPAPESPAPELAAPDSPPPQPPAPATIQGAAPPASGPSVPPATAEPTPPSVYAPLLTWMRQQFGHFLDHMGAPFANLSEPQRDALFAEFLAWHRTRTSADPTKPPAP